MNKIIVSVTLDIDIHKTIFMDSFEKFDCIFQIKKIIQKYPDLKITWFIRIDKNIKFLFGKYEYIYEKIKPIVESFNNENELGWHPHSYIFKNSQWQQSTDVKSILTELNTILPVVKKYNMNIVRMGWGYQSNEIMQFLSENNFKIDSSAIPRPQYKWEETLKDWSITPTHPYYPSKKDYRIPGVPSHSILEVPISVADIRAPHDTEDVMRYINLAYHPEILKPSLERWISNNSYLVTITHPYEIMPSKEKHGLISHSIKSFEDNINNIIHISKKLNKKVEFLTISEFAEHFIMEDLNG